MKKIYLLTFSSALLRTEATDWANACALIEFWRADLPNAIYLLASTSAKEISVQFHEAFPEIRFLVTEISSENFYGWLPEDTWQLLKAKEQPVEMRS